VVLSGGGVNGVLMELGFLKRLRVSPLWPRVGVVFGTSAGALSGVMAALDRIDDLEREAWTRGDSVERLRGVYRYRRSRFAARFDDDVDDGAIEDRSSAWGRMMFSVIDAQRRALEEMRRSGEISAEVMRTVERDLDLEERRLEEVRR
jgi:CPA1 family monovalent cation:H+ antiporter